MEPSPLPSPQAMTCYVGHVTPRLAIALLGACSTLGCADMLGLGGLTFEQQATGGTSTAGGSSGGAEGGAGGLFGSGGQPIQIPTETGGAPPILPKVTDEYPSTWTSGAVITATWSGFGLDALSEESSFWVYEPVTGLLTSHRLDVLEPDELGHSAAKANWDFLYAPTVDGTTWLFGYAAPTGLVDYGLAPLPGQPFATAVEAGSPGWTHVLLAGDPDSPFLIVADRSSRTVRIGPANPNAEDALVTSVVWDEDFTELLAYRKESVDGLLRLDSVLGEVAFVPIEDGMLGEVVELGLTPTPGWSLAATFPTRDGAAALALYRRGDGSIETYHATTDPSSFLHDSDLWRRDLSSIVPVIANGVPWALAFDATTGVADLRSLDPLEPTLVVK
jgi:hypothetical protein